MDPISRTQWLIMNATSDDYEDLEQIYRSTALEFSAERYNPTDADAFYWREAKEALLLSDIVDNIRLLVSQGLLSVKLATANVLPDTNNDLSYLWRGWFRITPKGREILLASESSAIETGKDQ